MAGWWPHPLPRQATGLDAQSIQLACRKAGVPVWSPDRLRSTTTGRIAQGVRPGCRPRASGASLPDYAVIYVWLEGTTTTEIMAQIG